MQDEKRRSSGSDVFLPPAVSQLRQIIQLCNLAEVLGQTHQLGICLAVFMGLKTLEIFKELKSQHSTHLSERSDFQTILWVH